MFEFDITHRYKKYARTGIFHTPHGDLATPNLAIVATSGEIRAMPMDIISQLDLDLIIVNTFHIYTKKIVEKILPNTVHRFSHFAKPIMSDSGGFQVFSMGFGKSHNVGKIGGMFPGKDHKNLDQNNLVEITEEGATFEFDGKPFILTPEKSMEIQGQIGADIIFAFDECTSPLNSKKYTKIAMDRTHRWIQRCLQAKKNKKQALFAIVQGGYFENLRKASARYMAQLDVPGFGIGGSLGKTKEDMLNIVEWTIPLLPDEKPRHLLGIGQIRDIFEAVERGVDLFDCVIPTREARHKAIYTKKGRLQVRKMKLVDEPLERDCACLACSKGVTWQKLHTLFAAKDPQAFLYSTMHNIQFYNDLMKRIRESIQTETFEKLKKELLLFY